MKPGKLSESVLKRSIFKQLKYKRQEVIQSTGIGEDCALFSFGNELAALSTSSFTVFGEELLAPQIAAVMNNVAAAGGSPLALLVSAILPKEIEESEIKKLAAGVEEICSHMGIQAAGGDTRISPWVTRPQLTLTVLGKAVQERGISGEFRSGQDVIMTKALGLLGTALLARQKREILEKRLPSRLIDEAAGFASEVCVIPEAAIAMKSGVSGMHDVSRGGIFAALWELAEKAGVGLEIDMKRLLVRQETIEITEALGINPYELHGGGSLLAICDRGSDLVIQLEKENIPAVIIGRTTADKAKVLLNQEEKRYLDRPAGDYLEELLAEPIQCSDTLVK